MKMKGFRPRLTLCLSRLTTKEFPMAKNKKPAAPKKRNMVAYAMMQRSAKAGRHTDQKKRASKRACRGRVRQ